MKEKKTPNQKKIEEYELLHERKVVCTCDEDPKWCELHNMDDFS